MDSFETIRDTPLGTCIGATILDITADDAEEFLKDPSKNRVLLSSQQWRDDFCNSRHRRQRTGGNAGNRRRGRNRWLT